MVLFTKKREAPPQIKALSTKYRDRGVHFGMVDDSDTAVLQGRCIRFSV